jgi:hypothetical protein
LVGFGEWQAKNTPGLMGQHAEAKLRSKGVLDSEICACSIKRYLLGKRGASYNNNAKPTDCKCYGNSYGGTCSQLIGCGLILRLENRISFSILPCVL